MVDVSFRLVGIKDDIGGLILGRCRVQCVLSGMGHSKSYPEVRRASHGQLEGPGPVGGNVVKMLLRNKFYSQYDPFDALVGCGSRLLSRAREQTIQVIKNFLDH